MTDVLVLPPESDNDKPHLPALSINDLILQAITSNLSVEALERILAMRRELRAEEAKEAFDAAMRDFQAECQPIVKRKAVHTKTGAVGYVYAPFEELDMQTKELRAKHGFSFSIETETLERRVKATCIIRHIGGHEYTPQPYEVPLSAGTSLMSNTQIVAAALSFATRYAFKNAFGLTIVGEDNEAVLQKQTEDAHPTPAELSTLVTLANACGFDTKDIAKKFHVEDLTRIKRSACLFIIQRLNDVLNHKGGKEDILPSPTSVEPTDDVIPGLND